MSAPADAGASWTTQLFSRVARLQDGLNFKGWTGTHFVKNGIGKISIVSGVLGVVGGMHFGALVALSLIPFYRISKSFLSILV